LNVVVRIVMVVGITVVSVSVEVYVRTTGFPETVEVIVYGHSVVYVE